MPSHRMQRVSELIKQEVSEIIRRDVMAGDVGLIIVSGCEVANDLKSARVYISVLGAPEKKKAALAILEREHGRIQRALGKAVVMKYTPHLNFLPDDSVQRGDRVLQILDELDVESLPETDTPSPTEPTQTGDDKTPPQN